MMMILNFRINLFIQEKPMHYFDTDMGRCDKSKDITYNKYNKKILIIWNHRRIISTGKNKKL